MKDNILAFLQCICAFSSVALIGLSLGFVTLSTNPGEHHGKKAVYALLGAVVCGVCANRLDDLLGDK